jgi:hypothetical protein
MRQHHKVREGANKKKKRWVWERSLEIYEEMTKPSPLSKSVRRRLLIQARGQASGEYRDR